MGTMQMTDDDRQRRRRNLLLFAAHVLLALAIVGWFVYSVSSK